MPRGSSNSQLRQLLTAGTIGEETASSSQTNIKQVSASCDAANVGDDSLYQQQESTVADGSGYVDYYSEPLEVGSETAHDASTVNAGGSTSIQGLDMYLDTDTTPWLSSVVDASWKGDDFEFGVSVLAHSQEQFGFVNTSIDEFTEQVLQSSVEDEGEENWTEDALIGELTSNQVEGTTSNCMSPSNRSVQIPAPQTLQPNVPAVKYSEYGAGQGGPSTSHQLSTSSLNPTSTSHSGYVPRPAVSVSAPFSSPSGYVHHQGGLPEMSLASQLSLPASFATSQSQPHTQQKFTGCSTSSPTVTVNPSSAPLEASISQQNSYYPQVDNSCDEQQAGWSNSSNGKYQPNYPFHHLQQQLFLHPDFAAPQGSVQLEHPLYVTSSNQQSDHLSSSNQQSDYLSSSNQQSDYLSSSNQQSSFIPPVNHYPNAANQQSSYNDNGVMIQSSPEQSRQSTEVVSWSTDSGHHPTVPLPSGHSESTDSQLLTTLSIQDYIESFQQLSNIQTEGQQSHPPNSSSQHQNTYFTAGPQSNLSADGMSESTVEACRRKNTEKTLKDCGLYDAAVLTGKLVNKDQQNAAELADLRQQVLELMKSLNVG